MISTVQQVIRLYCTGTKSSRTLKYRISLGLPRTMPVYSVNTTNLLHVTVSYGLIRFKPCYPAGPSEVHYIAGALTI